MSLPNIDHNIAKYESFINDVLREDLRKLEQKLLHINSEITDLYQEKNSLKVITDKNNYPNGFKSQVNVGCNFFMEASVTDTSKLLMNIGLNHFLEFTLDEAKKYLDVRIKAFEEKAEELKNKSCETKAHIKLMLMGVGELQNERLGIKSGRGNFVQYNYVLCAIAFCKMYCENYHFPPKKLVKKFGIIIMSVLFWYAVIKK